MFYILSHRDADGAFASYAVQRFCRMHRVEYKTYEVQYKEPFPFPLENLKADDEICIVDFSYPRELLEDIRSRVETLVVLDHHKSAKEELEGLEYALFDMSKSGALMAWEYFFPNKEVPEVCKLVNDRDLWKWEFGDRTKGFSAYFAKNKKGVYYDWWNRLAQDPVFLDSCIEEGMRLVAFEEDLINKFFSVQDNYLLAHKRIHGSLYTFALYQGMGFLTSELGEKFYTSLELDFTMEHRIRGDKMVFSLRSRAADACTDVSKIAQGFGGGGHVNAAGFALPIAEGFELLQTLYTKNP